MRVASKAGNLPSRFGHAIYIGFEFSNYSLHTRRTDGQTEDTDRRTDVRTDGLTKATLIAPFLAEAGGIIIYNNNRFIIKIINVHVFYNIFRYVNFQHSHSRFCVRVSGDSRTEEQIDGQTNRWIAPSRNAASFANRGLTSVVV